jgi:hypothetical protein
MYKMNEGWTDERMDDFRDEVNRRFDGVDQRFDRFEDKVDHELHRINDRLDSMYRAGWVIGGGILVALLGIIVQL